jgi:hypothetical protein
MPTLLALASAHDAEIVQRRVETVEEAGEIRFLGCPSVRVDGRDIEPGAESRTRLRHEVSSVLVAAIAGSETPQDNRECDRRLSQAYRALSSAHAGAEHRPPPFSHPWS